MALRPSNLCHLLIMFSDGTFSVVGFLKLILGSCVSFMLTMSSPSKSGFRKVDGTHMIQVKSGSA